MILSGLICVIGTEDEDFEDDGWVGLKMVLEIGGGPTLSQLALSNSLTLFSRVFWFSVLDL